jgi:hypothetical protein
MLQESDQRAVMLHDGLKLLDSLSALLATCAGATFTLYFSHVLLLLAHQTAQHRAYGHLVGKGTNPYDTDGYCASGGSVCCLGCMCAVEFASHRQEWRDTCPCLDVTNYYTLL